MAKMNGVAALILLAVVTIFAYLTAEHLVSSLEGMVEANPKVSKEWITLIIIPIISNAAEHTTALIVARKGKFDLAMSVAVGSCIQIAFLVIPILILVAWGMGKPLTLLFDPMETVVCFLLPSVWCWTLILSCRFSSSRSSSSSSLLRMENPTG